MASPLDTIKDLADTLVRLNDEGQSALDPEMLDALVTLGNFAPAIANLIKDVKALQEKYGVPA